MCIRALAYILYLLYLNRTMQCSYLNLTRCVVRTQNFGGHNCMTLLLSSEKVPYDKRKVRVAGRGSLICWIHQVLFRLWISGPVFNCPNRGPKSNFSVWFQPKINIWGSLISYIYSFFYILEFWAALSNWSTLRSKESKIVWFFFSKIVLFWHIDSNHDLDFG